MAGTNSVVAKKAIVDMLTSKTGPGLPLAGVLVSYDYPGKRLELENIYGARLRIDHSLSTFASAAVGGGRQPRTEIATLTFVVLVKNAASDQYAADARAAELGTVLEELLAGNPLLDGRVQVATVESGDLEPLRDDDGVWAQFTYNLTVQSELI